ncbi:MAG: aminotransferase class I/II-fold pyridoxal phosphate-dependent enzyme [Rhodocyclaceae bacterium]|nr:aminotransferase class I/II-fold pyridoxal phosphate-dependent enzyme [Rhodocyclaceae bacterium]
MTLTMEEKRAKVRDLLKQKTMTAGAAEGAGRALADIPDEYTRFELWPAYKTLMAQRETMARIQVANPYFKCHSDVSRDTLRIGDADYINFSGYNYVGLSGDVEVAAAAKHAIDCYGTSVSASRIVSGEIPLHAELEAALARFHGTEDAVVFVSGYGTNVSTLGYLFGPKDLLLHDSLTHNSGVTGCKLSGARRISFPHNDLDALESLLAENRGRHERACIVTEGVFSMDGDIPDLPRLIALKKRYKALLMVDEAHSAGTLGAGGRGIAEHFGVAASEIDILMGTLSKSFASCGGYIAGSAALTMNLRYFAPGGVLYSVGLSPANSAAALAAVNKLTAQPGRVERLRANSALFLRLAQDAGLDTGPSHDSPIVPVVIGNSIHCLKVAERLFRRGINVQPMLYPAVPEEASRLRFFVTASHRPEQLEATVGEVRDALAAARAERLN